MSPPLAVSMKATIGVMIAFVIFLAAGSVGTLLVGEWDIWIAVSLLIFVPLLAFLIWFAWKGKPWAYVGSLVLGAFVAVASTPTPGTLPDPAPALLLWETMLATVLGILMALEGFKAYVEARESPPARPSGGAGEPRKTWTNPAS